MQQRRAVVQSESGLPGETNSLAGAQRLAPQIPVNFEQVVDRASASLREVPACVAARETVDLAGSWAQDGLGRVGWGGRVDEPEDKQKNDGYDETEGEDHTVCAVAAACVTHGAFLER